MPFVITLPLALVSVLLFLRLCALRKDARNSKRFFGRPFDYMAIAPWELVSPEDLTEEGKRLLPWFMTSWVLFLMTFLVAGIIAIKDL